MQNIFSKIKLYIGTHKKTSIAGAIFIILLGFWIHGKITSTTGDTRYITGKVQKGTIIASVSATGQVSATTALDLKPKVSGNITYIGVQNGARVGAGTLIAEIDTTDAQKAVRDATQNLQSANLSLEKLKIQNSNQNLSADSKKAYDDALSAVADTFLDLPGIVTGLDDTFNQNNLSDNAARQVSKTAQDYRNKAQASYDAAKADLDQNKKDYVVLNSSSTPVEIQSILTEAHSTTTAVSNAVKNTLDFVNFMADNVTNDSSSSAYNSTQTTLGNYTNTLATHLSALTSSETNINNNKDTSQNVNIDLQSAELSVTAKQNALQDAKDNLADYFIRAPFTGTVAGMTIKKGDSVGGSTTIATIITDQQLADVSMNEVDVAKIKVGDKATLTFDAIPDLTISGTVAQIDSLGTVSQGVVTYDVKINFDTQDARIKPSMSVSASIITDTRENVLIVPNSAVKVGARQNNYVEMFDAPLTPPADGLIGSISKIAPNNIPVEIGLANDSDTEIISGINEGDEIVTRTILPSATKTAAAPSLFGSTGGTRTGATGGARPIGR